MNKNNSFLVFSIFFMFIFTGLGFWQIQRLKEKNILINRISKVIDGENREIENFELNKDNLYRKISVNGRFLLDHNIFLYGNRASAEGKKDGYFLLQVFKSDAGENILAARGWINSSKKNNLLDIDYKDLEDNLLEGIILAGETHSFYLPDHDKEKNIWFSIDLAEIGEFLGIDLEPIYIMQTNVKQLPYWLEELSTKKLLKIRNNHMEYIITWFALALFLLGFIIRMLLQKKHKEI